MSLSALVAFAQKFGPLAEDTRFRDANEDHLSAANPAIQSMSPLRPGVPTWVSGREPEQELPTDADHPWKIDAPVERQSAPPDVTTLGPDALAFYAPFHFYRNGWGIFVRTSGVVYLADILKGSALEPGDEHYLELAESLLTAHESHHAATEIACTRAELMARRPLYHSYFHSRSAAELEEALANARAFSWAFDHGDQPAGKARAQEWMNTLGAGYRDYGSGLSSRAFSRGLNHTARFFAAGLAGPNPRADSSLHTFFFRGARNYRSMPVVRLNDLGGISISILRPFPREHGVQVFVHSNDHPPPHIHVQALSGREETRYSWPELVPLENDRPLSSRIEKGLKTYIEQHRTKINARVRSVYGLGAELNQECPVLRRP